MAANLLEDICGFVNCNPVFVFYISVGVLRVLVWLKAGERESADISCVTH